MKGEETKNRIIDCAADLFWARGFRAVSMADIAKAAGINKATPYQYFDSKEKLAEAVVFSQRQWTIDIVFDKAFGQTADPKQRLDLIYTYVHDTNCMIKKQSHKARGCPFINVAMELAHTNDDIRQAVDESFQAFGAYYRDIVRAIRGPGLSQEDENQAVNALLRNMDGAMVASKIKQNTDVILEALPTAQIIARG